MEASIVSTENPASSGIFRAGAAVGAEKYDRATRRQPNDGLAVYRRARRTPGISAVLKQFASGSRDQPIQSYSGYCRDEG
jgi:hypothetical protein